MSYSDLWLSMGPFAKDAPQSPVVINHVRRRG